MAKSKSRLQDLTAHHPEAAAVLSLYKKEKRRRERKNWKDNQRERFTGQG